MKKVIYLLVVFIVIFSNGCEFPDDAKRIVELENQLKIANKKLKSANEKLKSANEKLKRFESCGTDYVKNFKKMLED